MIDWLSFVAPCTHDREVFGGQVFALKPDGRVEWQSLKRLQVRGSFDDSLTVRTHRNTDDALTHIEVAGNPVKFFQGHNLWGSSDVHSIVLATLDALAARDDLGLLPTPEDRQRWLAGDIRLTRVDQTESFHLANLSDVLAWLRAAEQTAHLSHRGRGQLTKGSTLYFGKNSRRWSLKLYAKGQEVRAKGHGQSAIYNLPHALAWADRTLRAELVLRSMELKRRGLDTVAAWTGDVDSAVTSRLLLDRLGAMTMNSVSHLPASVLDALKPSLRMAYQSWESGVDLRAILPKRTFYRYRAELLPHGIDLATVNSRETSNVVPLVRVLEAVPVGVPDWAQGTPLYWEPRRVA